MPAPREWEVGPAVSSLSIQDRAAESERLIIDRILPHLSGVKQSRGRNHWAFYCPLGHRKKNASAAIWVNEAGWVSVHCFDCQRNADLRDAIVTPALAGRDFSPTGPPSTSHLREPSRAVPAEITWKNAEPIPRCDHPARRWFQHRNLWRPEVEAPHPLRWLPAGKTFPGPHLGAGSIVALLAPPSAWITAWPGLPHPMAVEIIAIDDQGFPSKDRPSDLGGLEKRTLGNKRGCVLLLGAPGTGPRKEPVRVAEGMADALALAARFSGLSLATMGDAGMKAVDLALWLSTLDQETVIHADNDSPGREAANRLVLALKGLGVPARAVLPPCGKDAADTAAHRPFLDLRGGWQEYSDRLTAKYGWPRWESQRQAAILMGDEQDK